MYRIQNKSKEGNKSVKLIHRYLRKKWIIEEINQQKRTINERRFVFKQIFSKQICKNKKNTTTTNYVQRTSIKVLNLKIIKLSNLVKLLTVCYTTK